MNTVEHYPGIWKPVPGYSFSYWINQYGEVRNSSGHIVKPIPSKLGKLIELRQFGQRERVLISDIQSSIERGDSQ